MAAALEVINSDPAVRSILVNIFGGITRVDEVAKGVLEALGRVDIGSPIVLRLDGTNAVAVVRYSPTIFPNAWSQSRPCSMRHAERSPSLEDPHEYLRRREHQGGYPRNQPDQPGPLPWPA